MNLVARKKCFSWKISRVIDIRLVKNAAHFFFFRKTRITSFPISHFYENFEKTKGKRNMGQLRLKIVIKKQWHSTPNSSFMFCKQVEVQNFRKIQFFLHKRDSNEIDFWCLYLFSLSKANEIGWGRQIQKKTPECVQISSLTRCFFLFSNVFGSKCTWPIKSVIYLVWRTQNLLVKWKECVCCWVRNMCG